MPTDKSASFYNVMIIPDENIELWDDQTNVDERSPNAGIPVPGAKTHLGLTATGEQTSDINYRIIRPGIPTPEDYGNDLGGTASQMYHLGCRNTWKPTNFSDSAWYGYDSPRCANAWQGIFWNDSDITAITNVTAVNSVNDQIIMCAGITDTGEADPYRLEALYRSNANGAWTRVAIETFSTSTTIVPVIVALPSGRLQIYRALEDQFNYALRMWYSDDNGVTWSFGGDGIIDKLIATTPSRMRMEYSDGQILFLVRTSSSVHQYASSDLGMTFQYICDINDGSGFTGTAFTNYDICRNPYGGFVIAAAEIEDTVDGVTAMQLSSAYDNLSIIAADDTLKIQIPSDLGSIEGVVSTDDVAIVVDSTNLMTLYIRSSASINGSDANNVSALLSYDGGSTWGNYYETASTVNSGVCTYDQNTGSSYLYDFFAVAHRAKTLLFHNWSAGGTGTSGTGLGVLYLGGWTNVTVPSRSTAKVDSTAQGWSGVWFPTEIPSAASGWTPSAGAATTSFANNAFVLQTGASVSKFYTNTTGGTGNIAFRIALKTPNGNLNADEIGAKIVTTGGGSLSIRVASTGYKIFDNNATAVVGTEAGADFQNNIIEIWGEIDNTTDSIYTWYRNYGYGDTITWTAGPSGTFSVAGSPSEQFSWGHIGASAGPQISEWSDVKFARDDDRIITNGNGFANPNDLRGRSSYGILIREMELKSLQSMVLLILVRIGQFKLLLIMQLKILLKRILQELLTDLML